MSLANSLTSKLLIKENIMRKQKVNLSLLLVALVVVLTTTLVTLRGQDQAPPISVKNQRIDVQNDGPIADYTTEGMTAPQHRAVRQARGRRYQKRGDGKPLSEMIGSERRTYTHPSNLSALPVAASDLVAIGEVTEAQAFLSDDKTSVYSEFTFRVAEVLMNKVDTFIASNDSITISREGGRALLPSKRIIKIYFIGYGLPRAGQRYIFFLKRNEEADFSIVTGYMFRDNRVFPLDSVGGVFEVFKNSDEASFLQTVRNAIASCS